VKISLSWIGEFLDLDDVAPERVAELLTLHTAEVEGLEGFGGDVRGVVVGEVVECGRHPNADKLSLTRVAFGGDEAVQVVCGASNVARGQKIAFAPVGCVLPGGVKLKKARLRGVESNGMICSERELGLGDNHRGILVLPPEAPVGAPLAGYLGMDDSVVEIDNKSLTHRPDLWGHYGFARELAAILGRPLKPLPVLEDWPQGGETIPIHREAGPACPLYLGLPVELGGPPAPSPMGIKLRLLAVGQRPLNDLVDLTNYVLLETGQPTHAFDFARLHGPAIRVRHANPGEEIVTLDGVARALTKEDLLIGDQDRAVALAGVMGGGETEVSAETATVLLESAVFDPVTIRRTSQRLALRTEASARFEKSLDPALAEQALRRFALLLAGVRPQARILGAPSAAGTARAPERTLELDPARTASLLGLSLSPREVAAPLAALGFEVAEGKDALRVKVPSWRATKDVTRPIDLVEEVGRMAGYHRIEPAPLQAPVVAPRQDPARRLGRTLADRLALTWQAFETQAPTFLERSWAARLHLPEEAFLVLANPVQAGVDLVRRDPMASLLLQAQGNRKEREQGFLFEVAKGYEPGPGALPAERSWVGSVVWRRQGKNPEGPASLFGFLRGAIRDLLGTAGVEGAEGRGGVEFAAAPWCHPVRSLSWRKGETLLGFSGELHPRLKGEMDWERTEVGLLLLDLSALLEARADRPRRFRSPGRFPAVKVDVALALPRSVPYAQVEAALRKAGGKLLESLELFDLFTGESLGEGQRSLAFHAVLRAPDRTLGEKEERRFLEKAEQAARDLGGRLRS